MIDHEYIDCKRLLDPQDCRRAADDLLALRDCWIRRNALVPFFTFGAASYLDAAHSRARYLELAADFNPRLRNRFGWLLDQVSAAISASLGFKTQWHAHGALPGFHIFLAHPAFSLPVASIHFDRQYLLIDWSGVPDPDFNAPLSFTLPIELPAAGGGLKTWSTRETQFNEMREKQQGNLALSLPFELHEYRIGELVIHSGNMLHQIAPSPRMEPGDRRITLQGHGIRAGDRIYLYW